MMNYLKNEANKTFTENGAITYKSSLDECLDLFASIGALRRSSEKEIVDRFIRSFAADRDITMKILFYCRDIRGGLGERRVFREIIRWLAFNESSALKKNITFISEYGRYDDLLCLLNTPCEEEVIEIIKEQLAKDNNSEFNVSLLAKWLPSINASNKETIKNAKYLAKKLSMTNEQYRKMLSNLRQKIKIIENNLRKKDYSFDYSCQPSKAMLKYRKAFLRNDKNRYLQFIDSVNKGEATMNTSTLTPFDIVKKCYRGDVDEKERSALDACWNSLEDFTGEENYLAVIDGSGSMYGDPISVAISLGIYFAQNNKGAFKNQFITFSTNPQLVDIKGKDIYEKVRYCASYNEVANTDLEATFRLLLEAAISNKVSQEELPKRLYIISDMEFDRCVNNCDLTNFENAKKMFEQHGYQLPEIVFWNVSSRHRQQPVKYNDRGVALVSGYSARLFSLISSGELKDPYSVMMDILNSERYANIKA